MNAGLDKCAARKCLQESASLSKCLEHGDLSLHAFVCPSLKSITSRAPHILGRRKKKKKKAQPLISIAAARFSSQAHGALQRTQSGAAPSPPARPEPGPAAPRCQRRARSPQRPREPGRAPTARRRERKEEESFPAGPRLPPASPQARPRRRRRPPRAALGAPQPTRRGARRPPGLRPLKLEAAAGPRPPALNKTLCGARGGDSGAAAPAGPAPGPGCARRAGGAGAGERRGRDEERGARALPPRAEEGRKRTRREGPGRER